MKHNLFFFFIIVFFSTTSFLYSMDDDEFYSRSSSSSSHYLTIEEEDNASSPLLQDSGSSDGEGPITDYIRNPSDALGRSKSVILSPLPTHQPLIAHEEATFDFGKSELVSVLNEEDHYLHYFVGKVDGAIHEANPGKAVKYVNLLLLGLDAVYVVNDVRGVRATKRTTKPILYNRHHQKLTIDAGEDNELCFFLSFNPRWKKNHRNIVELSRENPFNVNFRGKVHKVYFHPSNIFTDPAEKKLMYNEFPELNENYDSEVNAVYSLLINSDLIFEFLNALESPLSILSLGLRYYSFLDMCGRCQEFLEYNQRVLKPLFMEKLYQLPSLKNRGNIPFIVVAHSNRIYKDNTYQIGTHTVAHINRDNYPYALSGPPTGKFLEQFPRHAGSIKPIMDNANRLVAIIHEPDLGKEDELGIVRRHFAHLEQVDFSRHSLKDEHVNTLATKLERTDPLNVTEINLSDNYFGMEEPEFGDDPIPLTDGKKIVRALDFVSSCRNLLELRIGNNHISQPRPFFALLKNLRFLINLRVLELNGTGLGASECSNHIQSLSEVLPSLTSLEILDLSYNFIYYEGAVALSQTLINLQKLRELYFGYAALCHKDEREHYDDPFVECLVYNPGGFFKLVNTIRILPNINFVDIRHYNGRNVQILESDRDEFVRIIKDNKPNVFIDVRGKKFTRS